MREKNLLIRILRDLASLIEDEASKNPAFGSRLEAVLQEVPRREKKRATRKVIRDDQLPDLFLEAKARSASDFEHWLASLNIPVLKALVRKHDLDSSRRTQKWHEPEKFAKLIAEQIQARMQRGSAFLSSGASPNSITHQKE